MAKAASPRASGVAGDTTVLDEMLATAFNTHRSPQAGSEGPLSARPPRGPGSGNRSFQQRGNAQSASPRPQRWRPVDAVRLAKQEVAQSDGVPAKARLGMMEVPAPLHDGFYDFAAAVVKPQPSARNYALQLREQLDEKLASVRRSDVAARSGAEAEGANAAQKKAITIAGERSCREVEMCVDTVEQYIRDTSTDSKERSALLERLRTVSADALQQLLTLLKICSKDYEEAEKQKIDLETSLTAVEEDNGGLRHVVQQMLATESDLQTSNQALQKEVEELQMTLDQIKQRNKDLTSQLESTRKELEDLRDEQARGRPTCDRCVSPMMGFSTFVMSTDQVPAPVSTENFANENQSWVRQEAVTSLSGFEQETVVMRDKVRRKTFSSQNPAQANSANMVANMFRQSVRLSTAFMESQDQAHIMRDMGLPETRKGQTSRHGSRSAMGSPLPPAASRSTSPTVDDAGDMSPRGKGMTAELTFGQSRTVSDSGMHRSPSIAGQDAGFSRIQASPVPQAFEAPNMMQSRGSSISQESQIIPRDMEPSVLATSFSELLPFVDFATLDPGLERSQADAIAQSQEHLEKHMVMLQDDYQREVAQNEELQHSVDTALERILVWVQAVHDSLQDLANTAVQQDVKALTTMRDALQWLAKHPCKDWTSKPGKLEEVLDDHEHELRACLEADRPNDSEVEELRKSIVQHRSRVQELSDQLLEARSSSVSIRSGRRIGTLGSSSVSRRVSSLRPQERPDSAGEASNPLDQVQLQHTAVQCDMPTPRATSKNGKSPGGADQDAIEAVPPITTHRATDSQSPDTDIISNSNVSSISAFPPTVHQGDLESNEDSSSAMGEEQRSGMQRKTPAFSSQQLMVHEAKKMRLLRSPFVEDIDFLLVPAAGLVMLSVPGGESPQADESKLLGLKQLHAVLSDLYTTKRADDLRRDKVQEERRPLYIVLQEVMRRSHGVKKVVHQKSWLLVESMAHHAGTDKKSALCSDFLDGTRDIDELSFYLYCLQLLTISIADESKAFPVARLPDAFVSYSRAQALAEMLFGDLPKALSVVQAEFAKCVQLDRQAEDEFATHFFLTGISTEQIVRPSAYCVHVENVADILLEGWRMCALLMDQSIPNFSWRKNVLAFLQTDVCHRGWLDPHQVTEAESRRLRVVPAPGAESILIKERTSLGAFVFRALQRSELEQRQAARVATLTEKRLLNPREDQADKRAAQLQPRSLLPATAARKKARQKKVELCLQVGNAAFDSVKKTLEVYLKWMMHSEELRDLAAYRSVKAQIYGFKQAFGNDNANLGMHHLRSMLILLLAHQFDVQFQQEDLSPEYLDWELRLLLHVLRESWKHGAEASGDPEFVKELAGKTSEQPASPEVEDDDH